MPLVAGFVFDLSTLHAASDHPYHIEHDNHKYELNVCGTLKDSACGNADANIGVCSLLS